MPSTAEGQINPSVIGQSPINPFVSKVLQVYWTSIGPAWLRVNDAPSAELLIK